LDGGFATMTVVCYSEGGFAFLFFLFILAESLKNHRKIIK
jgi:hypothetical protein